MKVILLKDVAKIGRRYDVVVVPDGYALNKLLPCGAAKPATPENIKLLTSTKEKQKEGKENEKIAFAELLEQIKDLKITIEVDANNEGRMFQSLKSEAIVESILRATGNTRSVLNVQQNTPIKTLGEHLVTLVSGSQKKDIEIRIIAKSK